jgi:hypothetical protein
VRGVPRLVHTRDWIHLLPAYGSDRRCRVRLQ